MEQFALQSHSNVANTLSDQVHTEFLLSFSDFIFRSISIIDFIMIL